MIINMPSASTGFISSPTEPSGTFNDGTRWYNPTTKEIKTYVTGLGFLSGDRNTLSITESLYTIPATISTIQDIEVPIGIESFSASDILLVTYEGLMLSSTDQYIIDYTDKTVTLLDFTVEKDEQVGFTVIKIV